MVTVNIAMLSYRYWTGVNCEFDDKLFLCEKSAILPSMLKNPID